MADQRMCGAGYTVTDAAGTYYCVLPHSHTGLHEGRVWTRFGEYVMRWAEDGTRSEPHLIPFIVGK